jgi:hypothetical protein
MAGNPLRPAAGGPTAYRRRRDPTGEAIDVAQAQHCRAQADAIEAVERRHYPGLSLLPAQHTQGLRR